MSTLAERLKRIVRGDVATDADTLKKYSRDTSIFSKTPEVVVFPKDTSAKILTSGEELPLDVILDNMRWEIGKARTLEKLMAGVETAEVLAEVRAHRAAAGVAAKDAAPYLHARLAPILPKGEKGLQVQLIIEDA